MRPFNCLSSDCSLLGPHLLEASAGTGKTFSMEHVFVRLLLEVSDLQIEKILAVTFTRAAASELKLRIRANLEEALRKIRSKEESVEYLNPYLGVSLAERKLSEALAEFDRCQIFTIHGFCYRMLKEFAFEAGTEFVLSDPDEGVQTSKQIQRAARRFLETEISHHLICPEQMQFFITGKKDIEALVDELLKKKKNNTPSISFSDLSDLFHRAWDFWGDIPLEEEKLQEDFLQIAAQCKGAKNKEDYLPQVAALAKRDFRSLLRAKLSIFDLLDPENRKKKQPPLNSLYYPGFWGQPFCSISSVVQQAKDRRLILAVLQEKWEEKKRSLLQDLGPKDPDAILQLMHQALSKEAFVLKLRRKYKAVIIDEFQDTDPLQWEIFHSLFLQTNDLSALYLVGDPKQSIYRFRDADVYTYFRAKHLLGESAWFSLDTNYRSSPKLIATLNALFAKDFLPLPKTGGTIASPPVKAGKGEAIDFQDGKGALHIVYCNSLDDLFVDYCAEEIHKLFPFFQKFSSFSILVKDRYQALHVQNGLKKYGIPSSARSRIALGETFAFSAVYELFQAIGDPGDGAKQRLVEASPFAYLFPLDFASLNRYGLSVFFRRFAHVQGDREFQTDLAQIMEDLLFWETKEGFSIPGILAYLEELKKSSSEEKGRQHSSAEKDKVQILTLHTSKGLEFDVVFALGLSAPPSKLENEQQGEKEELNAEKLRQLYVAMTRAKERLYVPVLEDLEEKESPMGLFCRFLSSQGFSFMTFIETLSKTHSITYETISSAHFQEGNLIEEENGALTSSLVSTEGFFHPVESSFGQPPFPITACRIESFTSLARSSKHIEKSESISESTWELCTENTPHTIPKGPQTGILIHHIFENIFTSSNQMWKNPHLLNSYIETVLAGTELFPWLDAICFMVEKTLRLPLIEGFCLIDLEDGQFQAEMEFIYQEEGNFVTGLIDLVFFHQGKLYLIDWKTNWLGKDDAAYLDLDEAMKEHDYLLQAKLYSEALKRNVKRFYAEPFEEIFGGAFYLFVRGGGIFYWRDSQ